MLLNLKNLQRQSDQLLYTTNLIHNMTIPIITQRVLLSVTTFTSLANFLLEPDETTPTNKTSHSYVPVSFPIRSHKEQIETKPYKTRLLIFSEIFLISPKVIFAWRVDTTVQTYILNF